MSDLQLVPGVIRVHTAYGGGATTVERYIDLAADAGLGYVIVTDLDSTAARDAGFQRRINGVLVAIGAEVTARPERQRSLVLHCDPRIGFRPRSNVVLAGAIRNRNGFTIWTPHVKPGAGPGLPRRREGFVEPTAEGIDLWSLTTGDVRRRAKDGDRADPNAPIAELVEMWDRIAQARPFFAIASVGPTPMASAVQVRALTTYLLLPPPSDNERVDLDRLHRTLASGRAVLADRRVGDASEVSIWADVDGQRLEIGDSLESAALEGTIRVRSPWTATWRLVLNGDTDLVSTGQTLDIPIRGPGAYRIEGWIDGRPWLFSNHFRLSRPPGAARPAKAGTK
jgi:hypothetical protein